jgi:hypothetical protein
MTTIAPGEWTGVPALPLTVDGYRRHALHDDSCVWLEKNCYIDIWIEILHALGLDPHAMLPLTIAVDFEGDQWTFFKPSHDELRDLYGITVQELTVWRPLLDHVQEHAGAGKLVLAEVDAWWLPDTTGTTYRHDHEKTTIAVAAVEITRRRLRYFHNAGFFELSDDDFAGLFDLAATPDPARLPLFAEFARLDRVVRRSPSELAARARALLAAHAWRTPDVNPFRRFQDRFVHRSGTSRDSNVAEYHKWAFATTRQMGAAFELTAQHLRWLDRHGAGEFAAPAAAFTQIAAAAKTLIFKAARAVGTGRTIDVTALFEGMAEDWERGVAGVRARLPPG